MEAPRLGEENGDAPAAGELRSIALSQIGLGDYGPQGATADPGAPQPIELPAGHRPEEAGVLGGVLRLFEPGDRRLLTAGYLMAAGSCIVLHSTAFKLSSNAEHIFAGFCLWTAGAAVTLLTLGGGGAGRAAARLEEALRAFF